MKEAVLFSEMIPPEGREQDFNNWYNEEHIPLRMNVPGFVGAHRYIGVDEAVYLAVYDMASTAVLQCPEYVQVKSEGSARTKEMLSSVSGFTRYTGHSIGVQKRADFSGQVEDAPFVYVVFFKVPGDRVQEFDDWYEQDHIPTLLEHRHWLMCRRFFIESGEPEGWTHLALHYLGDLSALSSKERERARKSEWRSRLAEEPWFKGHYRVFKGLGSYFTATGGGK